MKKLHKMGMMLATMAMMSEMDHSHGAITTQPRESKPVWERKKCKSCKRFGTLPCNRNRWDNPKQSACENWTKK